MELIDFIRIRDNILPENVLKNFNEVIKNEKIIKFSEATIIRDKGSIDKKVRDTQMFQFTNNTDSECVTHWANLLYCFFKFRIQEYVQLTKLGLFPEVYIQDMQLLKYEINNFYTWHIDHGAPVPRTLSLVFFVNDDYKGGDLCFMNPNGSKPIKIPVKKNRLIIWPSNFLYPHKVEPVTEGVKYSIVSWAL
jgi:Rps23 Pro-64 3,4-dihydroxylase Tpa1-like proline 4-hydroxylase